MTDQLKSRDLTNKIRSTLELKCCWVIRRFPPQAKSRIHVRRPADSEVRGVGTDGVRVNRSGRRHISHEENRQSLVWL